MGKVEIEIILKDGITRPIGEINKQVLNLGQAGNLSGAQMDKLFTTLGAGGARSMTQLGQGAANAGGALRQELAGGSQAATAKIGELQGKMSGLTTRLSDQQQEAGILAEELGKVSAKYGESSTQAARKQLALAKLTSSMGDTEKSIDRVARELQDESRSLDETSKRSQAFAQVMTGAFRQVGASAVDMGMKVVGEVKDMAMASIHGAADLQDAIAEISTIKPDIDTSAVFASLNEMQTRVPQTAAQLGDSLYNIFSSIEVSQEGAIALTEEFARSAVGAKVDAETFGTAALGVMNAYSLGVDDARHVSDVFFNTIALGVVRGDELAASLGPVTQSAKAAGVSLDELGAMMVGVTREGGPAAQNINNLNNFLQKLTTSEAQGQLQKLGIATATATGEFRPTLDVLADLKERLGGMTEAARANALQKMFPDAQARIGAQTLISQLDMVNQALETNQSATGAASAAYQTMSETLNKSASLTQNKLMGVATVMGNAVTPAIAEFLTGTLNPAIDSFGDFVSSVANADDPLARFADGANAIIPGLGTAAEVTAVLASGLDDALVPALYAAATAATVYGVASLPKATTATLDAAKAAGAWMVSLGPAGAVAAVAAGGVGLLTWQMQRYGEELDAITAKQLTSDASLKANAESVKLFNQSQVAQTETGKGLLTSLDALETKYAELQRIRTQFLEQHVVPQDETDTGFTFYQNLNQQMLELTNRMGAVRNQFGQLTQEQITGLNSVTAASALAYGKIQEGTEAMLGTLERTPEEIQKIADAYIKVYDASGAALTDLSSIQASFMSDQQTSRAGHLTQMQQMQDTYGEDMARLQGELEGATTEKQAEGIRQRITDLDAGYAKQRGLAEATYADQQNRAAEAYAAEAAAARTALGQQLIDRVNYMQQLGESTKDDPTDDISRERADAFINDIRMKYGVLPSIADNNFGAMNSIIDQWAQSTSMSSDQAIGSLLATEDQAARNLEAYNALVGTYTSKLRAERDAGSISEEEYQERLEQIPAQVVTEVLTNAAGAVQDWKTFELAQARVKPETTVNVATNVPEGTAAFDDLMLAQGRLKPTMTLNVSTNAKDAQMDFLMAEAKRAAMPKVTAVDLSTNAPAIALDISGVRTEIGKVPNSTVANLSTNAPAVAGMMGDVREAVNSIPASRHINITATVAKDVKRASPSPIERTMSAIDEFTKRAHTIKVDTAGMDSVKELVSIVSQVGGASESLAKVGSFKAPSDASLTAFFESLGQTSALAKAQAKGWTKEMAEATGIYLDAANKATDVISSGVDALMKLPDYSGVSRDQVLRFSNDLYGTISTLAVVVRDYDRDGVQAAADWSESTQTILGTFGPGIDGLMKLPTYSGVTRDNVLLFAHDLYGTVSTLVAVTRDFDRDGVEAAEAWASSAGSIVGIIGDGVDGLDKLSTYKGVPQQRVWDFAADVKEVTWAIMTVANDFDQDGPAAAGRYAESVGKVIAPIASSVDAFDALQDLAPVPAQKVDLLAAGMVLVVDRMSEATRLIDEDMLAETVRYSEATGKVLAPIGTAIQTFEDLREYEGVAPAAVQRIGNDMVGTVGLMVAITANVDGPGAQAAAEFATVSGVIFDGIGRGVDSLTKLREYEGVAPAQFARLAGDFDLATAMTRTMKERADITAREAMDFKEFVETATGRIRLAFEAISDLDGLTVNAEIRGRVHGTVDTSTTGGDGGDPDDDGTYDIPRVPGRATGGSILAGRMYEVGERGRELFIPGMSGAIIPHAATEAILGNVQKFFGLGNESYGNEPYIPDARMPSRGVSQATPIEVGRTEVHHHHYYNLTVNTQATSENVQSSFDVMRALAGIDS